MAVLGISLMDTASDSWLPCPRCDAKTKLLHKEPATGGGLMQHEHCCTRCRHKWRAEPEAWGVCPDAYCDSHTGGLDRTTTGYPVACPETGKLLPPSGPWLGSRSPET